MSKSKKIHISKEDRTLAKLAGLDAKVYVYCGDRKTLQKFIEDADNEYFHYGDGTALSERKPDSIMSINRNRTVNYPGYVGTLAFHHAEMVGERPVVRVDYRKYIAGCKNFIYKPL
ncbi:MAG: hypothetical protein LUE14_06265 [Clostridiales bacterium]|nr:hypothetical protein [Clostridiales bacterium]